MKNTRLKKERGITLVALVITIVVLLILAAVAITSLSGENNIIAKAQKARDDYNEAAKQEKDTLDSYVDIYGKWGYKQNQYNCTYVFNKGGTGQIIAYFDGEAQEDWYRANFSWEKVDGKYYIINGEEREEVYFEWSYIQFEHLEDGKKLERQ